MNNLEFNVKSYNYGLQMNSCLEKVINLNRLYQNLDLL